MTRREFGRLAAAGLPMLGATMGAADDDPMERYLDAIDECLRHIRDTHAGRISQAGQELAERVASGGRLFIYDSRGGYVSEALGRAGGLMAIAALPADSAGLTVSDAAIIVADEWDDPAAIGAGKAARAAGAFVVAIGGSRGTRTGLWAGCDAAIDNTLRGGVREPLSGVLNTAMLWALIAAYIESMEAHGKPPHIWMSIKRPGSKAFNETALAETAKVGY